MSEPNSIVNSNEGGIIDSAREFIQNATKTEEQKLAERPLSQKIQDAIPNSFEEAGARAGGAVDSGIQTTKNTADNVATDFKEKFNQRLEEDSTRTGVKLDNK